MTKSSSKDRTHAPIKPQSQLICGSHRKEETPGGGEAHSSATDGAQEGRVVRSWERFSPTDAYFETHCLLRMTDATFVVSSFLAAQTTVPRFPGTPCHSGHAVTPRRVLSGRHGGDREAPWLFRPLSPYRKPLTYQGCRQRREKAGELGCDIPSCHSKKLSSFSERQFGLESSPIAHGRSP